MASDEFGFVVVPRSGDGVGDGAQSDDDVGVDSDGERMVFQQPLSEQPWGFGGGQGVDDGTPKAGADKNKAAIDVDDDELEEGEVVDHLGEVMVNIVRALGIEQGEATVVGGIHVAIVWCGVVFVFFFFWALLTNSLLRLQTTRDPIAAPHAHHELQLAAHQ